MNCLPTFANKQPSGNIEYRWEHSEKNICFLPNIDSKGRVARMLNYLHFLLSGREAEVPTNNIQPVLHINCILFLLEIKVRGEEFHTFCLRHSYFLTL